MIDKFENKEEQKKEDDWNIRCYEDPSEEKQFDIEVEEIRSGKEREEDFDEMYSCVEELSDLEMDGKHVVILTPE